MRMLTMTFMLFCALIGFSRAACGDDLIQNRRYHFVQFVPQRGMIPAPLESKSQVLHFQTDAGVDYAIDVGKYAFVGVRETNASNLAQLQSLTDLHLHLMSKSVRKIVFKRIKLGTRLALHVSFQLKKRWKNSDVLMDYVCVLTVHRGIQYTFTIRTQTARRFVGVDHEYYDNFQEAVYLIYLFSFTR